jgi:hypothetical protein
MTALSSSQTAAPWRPACLWRSYPGSGTESELVHGSIVPFGRHAYPLMLDPWPHLIRHCWVQRCPYIHSHVLRWHEELEGQMSQCSSSHAVHMGWNCEGSPQPRTTISGLGTLTFSSLSFLSPSPLLSNLHFLPCSNFQAWLSVKHLSNSVLAVRTCYS